MDFTKMSPQEILDLGTATKEYAEVLKTWPRPNIDWNDQARALARIRMLSDIAKDSDLPDSKVTEQHLKAPTRDGHQLDLWVFRPKAPPMDGFSPLIVIFHGGGYIMGSPVDVADTARTAAKTLGAVVVVPSYRLAPEHPFPTCIEDGWDSLSWIARNAQSRLQADPSEGFIVAGESAGAATAVIVAHQARDAKLWPKITGLWLSAGTIRIPRNGADLEDRYKERFLSRTQPECLDNPIFSQELDDFIGQCLRGGGNGGQADFYQDGTWAGEQGHKGLPRIYMQLCGRDVNRDEGLIFRDMVQRAGVETKLTVYKGLPHCFWGPLKNLPEYPQWQKDCLDGFRWLLDY